MEHSQNGDALALTVNAIDLMMIGLVCKTNLHDRQRTYYKYHIYMCYTLPRIRPMMGHWLLGN